MSNTQIDHLADFQPLTEFLEQRMLRACGKQYSIRARQQLVKRHELPIVKIGSVSFVNLKALAQQLHERTQVPSKRRVRL